MIDIGVNNGEDGTHGKCPDPIELVLYVNAQSTRSATAIENIKSALSRFRPSSVTMTICDLAEGPDAECDRQARSAPPLAARAASPRTFILGHLTNPSLLLELLEGCEES